VMRFRPLEEAEIHRYVLSGEPLDKAGAHGVQCGAELFVEQIRGSFTSIMGLPLCETGMPLKAAGVKARQPTLASHVGSTQFWRDCPAGSPSPSPLRGRHAERRGGGEAAVHRLCPPEPLPHLPALRATPPNTSQGETGVFALSSSILNFIWFIRHD
jgi:hypothetical protein